MKTLTLTCDLGGSLTKAIVKEYPREKSASMTMGSAIADVGRKSVEGKFSDIPIESGIWVAYKSEYFVLGDLAVREFAGTSSLKKLKYEIAVPKLLGLIAAAMKRHNLTEAKIYMMCLLPSGEISDGDKLSKEMKLACRGGIQSCHGNFKVQLAGFKTAVEGSGVLGYRIKGLGKDKWSKRNVVMAMVGYRNASALAFENGVPVVSPTSDLGMNWMVSRFIDRSAVGLSASAAPKIVKALVDAYQHGDKDALIGLSRKSERKDKITDAKIFDEVMGVLFDEYSRALVRFISDSLDECDEVLLCGGTAYLVKPYLERYFDKEGIEIVWDGGVEVPEFIDKHDLDYRLADCYAMHETFVRGVDKMTGFARQAQIVG